MRSSIFLPLLFGLACSEGPQGPVDLERADTQDAYLESWSCKATDSDPWIDGFNLQLRGQSNLDEFWANAPESGSVTDESVPWQLEHLKLLSATSGVAVLSGTSFFVDDYHAEDHTIVLTRTQEPVAYVVTEDFNETWTQNFVCDRSLVQASVD